MIATLAALGVTNTNLSVFGVNVPAGYFFGLAAFTIFAIILAIIMLGGRFFYRATAASQISSNKMPDVAPGTMFTDPRLLEIIQSEPSQEESAPLYNQESFESYVPNYSVPRRSFGREESLRESDNRDVVLRAFAKRQSW